MTAEDRDQWSSLCARLEIPQPAGGTAATFEGAKAVADRIGVASLYPYRGRIAYRDVAVGRVGAESCE